jgi:hypothetical protein
MSVDKQARVKVKITEDRAEYKEYLMALVHKDGRPVAVELDPAHRTPKSAEYDLEPKYLRRLSQNADGVEVFEYLKTFLIPAQLD